MFSDNKNKRVRSKETGTEFIKIFDEKLLYSQGNIEHENLALQNEHAESSKIDYRQIKMGNNKKQKAWWSKDGVIEI